MFAASLSPPSAVLSGSAACKAPSMLSQQTQQMLLALICTVFTSLLICMHACQSELLKRKEGPKIPGIA